uniref:Carboxypeptidase B n=1 Tax=Astacus astacus TaxID=6715 RepID=CBPB_ASTAS|nr:RecName: Full=Carboxypeptidase B [Astacus astacus]prf//1004229A CPase B [Astacus astacus]
MDWTSYHDYDEINAWLDSLATDYPELASVEDVGLSYEGRTMKLLKLGKGGADKPIIFIDGGIHAREWIAPSTVTYIVNEFVSNSATYDDILSNVNFYVMPTINPDGYAYTFTDDRLWRKTRSETGSVLGCKGADPNRNWSFHWDEVGASDSPCSDIYAGPEPFSEVEMRNVRDQILEYAANIKVYLTFHSYSQLWMYPWGFTSDLPDDWQDLDTLATNAVDALTAVHGTRYEIGSSTNTIYAAAGGSDDWAKGEGGVKYAYTIELRDTGNYGFLLPENQIIPTGEETFEGVKVVANFVKDTYS